MTDIDVLRELLRLARDAEDTHRRTPGYRAHCQLTDRIQARYNLALEEMPLQ